MTHDWPARFPGLAALAAGDRSLLVERTRPVEIPVGTTLFSPGNACEAYLLVLDGSVRVQMLADNGREIVLYRVRDGESCVLTTACLLGEEVYAAEGVVEEPTSAQVVPRALFDDLMARSDAFRRFVFAGFGRRVAEILETMQDAVFHRVEPRLARHLLAHGENGALAATHRDLAAELGTAREVVSRHLKAFEKRGLVHLARGTISVADRSGLARLAAMVD